MSPTTENFADLAVPGAVDGSSSSPRWRSKTKSGGRVLGRAPRDFRDYAREAAASGVWEASEATVGGTA